MPGQRFTEFKWFVELGHFAVGFVKNIRKRGSAGAHFGVFSPRYS